MTSKELTSDDIAFFKVTVQDYLKLEEEIKILEGAVRARKERKKNIAETLLTFLTEKDISHVNLQGDFQGKQLLCKKSDFKSGIKLEHVEDALKQIITNETDIKRTMTLIESQRKVVHKSKLKIAKVPKAPAPTTADEVPKHLEYLYS
jgi:hypothetical protein